MMESLAATRVRIKTRHRTRRGSPSSVEHVTAFVFVGTGSLTGISALVSVAGESAPGVRYESGILHLRFTEPVLFGELFGGGTEAQLQGR